MYNWLGLLSVSNLGDASSTISLNENCFDAFEGISRLKVETASPIESSIIIPDTEPLILLALYNLINDSAFVFDGRNVLDRNHLEAIGFIYRGIGE